MRTLDAPGRRTGYDKGLATERLLTHRASRRTTPASPGKPRYGRQAVPGGARATLGACAALWPPIGPPPRSRGGRRRLRPPLPATAGQQRGCQAIARRGGRSRPQEASGARSGRRPRRRQGMEARRGETRRLLGEARFTTARPEGVAMPEDMTTKNPSKRRVRRVRLLSCLSTDRLNRHPIDTG